MKVVLSYTYQGIHGTILDHIVTNYHNLAPFTAFMKENPKNIYNGDAMASLEMYAGALKRNTMFMNIADFPENIYANKSKEYLEQINYRPYVYKQGNKQIKKIWGDKTVL